MADSFSKKEKTKQKAKKKQEKLEKIMERRNTDPSTKSFEDMIAYVDEYGNLSDKPPEAGAKKDINPDDILIGATPIEPDDKVLKGTVLFFDESKSYGFIGNNKTGEKLFVHSSGLTAPVKEGDKVSYEKERAEKGFKAVNVNKI